MPGASGIDIYLVFLKMLKTGTFSLGENTQCFRSSADSATYTFSLITADFKYLALCFVRVSLKTLKCVSSEVGGGGVIDTGLCWGSDALGQPAGRGTPGWPSCRKGGRVGGLPLRLRAETTKALVCALVTPLSSFRRTWLYFGFRILEIYTFSHTEEYARILVQTPSKETPREVVFLRETG